MTYTADLVTRIARHVTAMERSLLFVSALATAALPGNAAAQATAENATKSVLQPSFYGVPSSPAFELLPDKPTDVTHVLRPKDFQSTLSTWYDGSTLRAGVALDARPFIESAGTLKQYQQSYRRRLALRTVLSAGTAKAVAGSSDVITAIGLRIPLFDRADPRMDSAYQTRLIRTFTDALSTPPPTTPFPSAEEKAARERRASEALAPVRNAHEDSTWNSGRLDLGLAGSVLTRGGQTTGDSVEVQRGGVWLAGAFPFPAFGTRGQVTLSAQSGWARAATDTAETNRSLAGARAILFATRSFSASGEVAGVWTRHRRQTSLDDEWTHVGVLVEWAVPSLKGWLGVSYGGDAGRRNDLGQKFALRYAFYPEAAITR